MVRKAGPNGWMDPDLMRLLSRKKPACAAQLQLKWSEVQRKERSGGRMGKGNGVTVSEAGEGQIKRTL